MTDPFSSSTLQATAHYYQEAPTRLGIIQVCSHDAPPNGAHEMLSCAQVSRRMVSHISEIFGHDRRRMIRREVRLAVSVYLIETEAPTDSPHRPLAVLGYTKNISVEGLALIVPSIEMGGDITDSEHYLLRIILALPVGDVEMNAIAVRQERLDANSPNIGYLIGARISEMSESESELYVEYLRTLGGE